MSGGRVDPETPLLHLPDFDKIRGLFADRVGLSFTEASRLTFERRLGERLRLLGMNSFREYHQFLLREMPSSPEFQQALEAVTTAETYFFRQEQQLNSFTSEVMPRLQRDLREQRRLSIWSAGCSTGEETYTLAILVKASGLFDDWEVRVVGSDLCRTRIDVARAATYREASFRVTPDELRRRYFEQHDESWRVCSEVRDICQFNQLNILEDSALVGRVHVVFCRNVLIYFGEAARTQVVENLHRRLTPGGYLFLGHSESLVNAETEFTLLHLEGDLAYRKAVPGVRLK